MKKPDRPFRYHSQVALAEDIAAFAFFGLKRRDGITPAITHTRAVVAKLFSADDITRAVGWLHDIVEDTDITVNDLSDYGVRPDIIARVTVLTHPKTEPYEVYIHRVRLDSVTRAVKLADIAANLAESPTEHARKKYAQALAILDREVAS